MRDLLGERINPTGQFVALNATRSHDQKGRAFRAAVGTVIYPGVGTIVGAFATKDLNSTCLAIYLPGDVVLIELPAKKETRAVEFALKVNRAAPHFRAVG